MQINMYFRRSSKEVRQFFGLSDVASKQEYCSPLRGGIEDLDPDDLMKGGVPANGFGWEEIQIMFWSPFAGIWSTE